MAFRVTNNDTRAFNIPPEYNGGVLQPGASVVLYGAQNDIANAFGAANHGHATDLLGWEEVPDNTAGVIQPGSFVAAAPGNWAGQAPRSLADAVNRLAAAVYGGYVGNGTGPGIP